MSLRDPQPVHQRVSGRRRVHAQHMPDEGVVGLVVGQISALASVARAMAWASAAAIAPRGRGRGTPDRSHR
jgi:hypothetical protein